MNLIAMITIEIDHKKLSRKLAKLQKELDQITTDKQFLSSTGQLLASRGKQNIEDGGHGNKSYELLAESTRTQKAAKGYSLKPLQRTGLMKRSLEFEVSGGLYLSGVNYIKYHQSDEPREKLPQRKVFTVERDDYLDIQDFLVRRFEQKTS